MLSTTVLFQSSASLCSRRCVDGKATQLLTRLSSTPVFRTVSSNCSREWKTNMDGCWCLMLLHMSLHLRMESLSQRLKISSLLMIGFLMISINIIFHQPEGFL